MLFYEIFHVSVTFDECAPFKHTINYLKRDFLLPEKYKKMFIFIL